MLLEEPIEVITQRQFLGFSGIFWDFGYFFGFLGIFGDFLGFFGIF